MFQHVEPLRQKYDRKHMMTKFPLNSNCVALKFMICALDRNVAVKIFENTIRTLKPPVNQPLKHDRENVQSHRRPFKIYFAIDTKTRYFHGKLLHSNIYSFSILWVALTFNENRAKLLEMFSFSIFFFVNIICCCGNVQQRTVNAYSGKFISEVCFGGKKNICCTLVIAFSQWPYNSVVCSYAISPVVCCELFSFH